MHHNLQVPEHHATRSVLTRFLLAFVFLSSWYVAPIVMAQTKTAICTPDHAQDENSLSLTRLQNGAINARGKIVVPSPGYSVHLRIIDEVLTLEIDNPPEEFSYAQVITTLPIEQTLHLPTLELPLKIEVKKDFGWGVVSFICE